MVCTNASEDVERPEDPRVFAPIEKPEMRVTEAQNYMIQNYGKGHILPISDDMEFEPNAIACAQYYLLEHFPDADGILGFKTENFEAKETSVMMIGERFIDRFAGRHVYFPGYKHFGADTELGEFAKSLGRFRFCKEAVVRHFHPVAGYPMDETHVHGRKFLEEDLKLFDYRRENNMTWGRV